MHSIRFLQDMERELNDTIFQTLSKIIDDEPFDLESFFLYADYEECKQIQLELQENNLVLLISAIRTNEFAKILFIHRVAKVRTITHQKKWRIQQMNSIKWIKNIQIHTDPVVIQGLSFDGWITGKLNGLLVSRVIFKDPEYDLLGDLYKYCDFVCNYVDRGYFLILLIDTDKSELQQIKERFRDNYRIMVKNHLEFQQWAQTNYFSE